MEPMVNRITFPLHDPPSPRGRRRSIYLKSLDLEIRALEQEKMKLLLDLVFGKPEGHRSSTNTDETP